MESQQKSPNQEMVVIVDDDSDISMLFTDALCGIEGISVFTFNESLEALKHFTKNKEEYILFSCDLMMPKMNGLDLVKKIKLINPKIRIIITSCYEIESSELQTCINKGIIDKIIEKPVSMNTLCHEVKN